MPADNKVVVLVRHGETEWSKAGQHTGRSDIPLTENGRTTALRLRARLAEFGFARVFQSPLSRARDTCALAGLGARAEDRPDLLEWDYGRYEGKTSAQIHEIDPSWSLWQNGAPDGELPAQVAARVDRVIAEVAAVDADVALFAHGHILRVLAARWIEQGPELGERLALNTASVGILGTDKTSRAIRLWNDVSHLRG